MPLTLTFTIPSIRNVKTRAVVDPAQYDTEINAARGFTKPIASKSKKPTHTIQVQSGIVYDPEQYDTEENMKRHTLQRDGKSR